MLNLQRTQTSMDLSVNRMIKRLFPALFIALFAILSCQPMKMDIVKVDDGSFVVDGNPYYYIGTNFWYGGLLGSEYGDRSRLAAELDSLHALGLDNLRVLVGSDGPDGVATRVYPTLQKEPGVYDEKVFEGLDYLMAELGKRNMRAVLYINNSWEWSGGYGMYLEWAGAGKAIIPSVGGYGPFMEQMAQYATNARAQELFENHLRTVVSRVNSITGKPYSEDPAIFSWQIGNEPRCFSSDPAVQDGFVSWIWRAASIIKSIDPNHMVSTGNEGIWGCEENPELFRRLNECPDIDYITAHIWPYNWSWVGKESPQLDIDRAEENTGRYIDAHLEVAESLGKPLVIEEFGFPRDDMQFAKGTPVSGRDRYYRYVFSKVMENQKNGGRLAGANFWSWGGFAVPAHRYWQEGDDYAGDPAQEEQGLNSVFADDYSTLAIIRHTTARLSAVANASAVLENDWMFTTGDQKPLRVAVQSQNGFRGSVPVYVRVSTDKGVSVSVSGKKARLGKGADTLDFDLGLAPGFYKVCVSLNENDPLDENFCVGCDPEKIVSPQDKQPDFDEFWEDNLRQLAMVPMNARMTPLKDHSNADRTAYRVDMKSFGGKEIAGLLYLPNKEGKFAARISYMGYGSDVWFADPSAEPDMIEFTLSVRDQGFNKTPGQGWVTRGLADKDTYYYRGAYLDCVRAIDFVSSLPQTDPDHIYAEGGSQGGAFTLIAASLDNRLRAIAPFVPFLSDFPDYFAIADWPGGEVLSAAKAQGISEDELYKTLSYFDVKNFTDRIGCPVLMGFGLQDPVCPPHTNFSGYNQITTDKQWLCVPVSGHHLEQFPEWWAARTEFFTKNK